MIYLSGSEKVGDRLRAIEDGTIAKVSYKECDTFPIIWKIEDDERIIFGIELKDGSTGLIERFLKHHS